MPYRVILAPAAQRDLLRLPEALRRRCREILRALTQNPRPPGARKLQGQERTFRLRVGDYRLVYDVRDKEQIVEVLRIARRTERTYRRL